MSFSTIQTRARSPVDSSHVLEGEYVVTDFKQMMLYLKDRGNSCVVSAADIAPTLVYIQTLGKSAWGKDEDVVISVRTTEDGNFRICRPYDKFGVQQPPAEFYVPSRK